MAPPPPELAPPTAPASAVEKDEEGEAILYPKWSTLTSSSIYLKDKRFGKYYLVRIVGLIKSEEEYLIQALKEQPKALANKRGLQLSIDPKQLARELREGEPRKVEQGDWLRIHYDGFSEKHDEWVCFRTGGVVCTRVKSEKAECHCERHFALPPQVVPLSTSSISRPFSSKVRVVQSVTLSTRVDLSIQFWKRVQLISSQAHSQTAAPVDEGAGVSAVQQSSDA